jgi:hypothetical protein
MIYVGILVRMVPNTDVEFWSIHSYIYVSHIGAIFIFPSVSSLTFASCHERIRTIAPVIEANSIKELSEVVKQLYIHSCSTGA